jgi:hypothetical protein
VAERPQIHDGVPATVVADDGEGGVAFVRKRRQRVGREKEARLLDAVLYL